MISCALPLISRVATRDARYLSDRLEYRFQVRFSDPPHGRLDLVTNKRGAIFHGRTSMSSV